MYCRLIRIAGSATHIAMRYRINVAKQEALNQYLDKYLTETKRKMLSISKPYTSVHT